MEKPTKPRRDVFNADLIWGAILVGQYGFPLLKKSHYVPRELVSFPKRKGVSKAHWVHFYVHDYEFVGIWRNPHRYLEELRLFEGVITPDFSVYCDMPLAHQLWSVFKSRAIGYWLQSEGVKVIPNVRWGDDRTYPFAFDGIPTGGTVVVGTLGGIKNRANREVFMGGFRVMLDQIRPKTIVVYGGLPDGLLEAASQAGARCKVFDSERSRAYREDAKRSQRGKQSPLRVFGDANK